MSIVSKHSIISRIAPTPSGFLHAGNAFSFVLTWLLVRKAGGKLWLRIDDIDAARKKPEYVEDIFRTLEWLGIDFDSGPQGPDDFEQNFSQRHRQDLYSSVLAELEQLPGLLYACDCSRKVIQLNSPNGIYPGTCRHRTENIHAGKCAVRVRLREDTEVSWTEYLDGEEKVFPVGAKMGDFVIRRKDGIPAYQLVSLADDMDYGVNLLVRGSDLLESSAAQLYLAACLDHSPEGLFSRQAKNFRNSFFLHHPLILNSSGEKLSKSAGASSIAEMRKAGQGPEGIFAQVALYLNLPQDTYPHSQALLRAFRSFSPES